MSNHVLQPAFDALKNEFELACRNAAEKASGDVLTRINQLLRRFRHYENEADWLQILLEGLGLFARQLAIFSLEDAALRLRLQAGLKLPPNFSFRLAQARAFATACEQKDPVTTLRTPGEVTARLSDDHAGERAHLIPILNGTRVVAVLFAAGSALDERHDPDVNALELITGIAAIVLERQANSGLHSQIGAAPQASTRKAAAPEQPAAEWADLSNEQRQLHIRAQRFARVTVAEMQLARPEACKAGREQGDLYLFLKREIDKARESYRRQFMTLPFMVDYLHLELIHTAAEGDESKLGADYPGQLL